MKQLVEYILSNITQKPEAVKVTEDVDDSDLHTITISVDPEDMGRVIGKSGKVIHSIRNLVRVAAIQKNLRVRVILEDDKTSQPTKEKPTVPPVENIENPEDKPNVSAAPDSTTPTQEEPDLLPE